jgi:hypothetical protein
MDGAEGFAEIAVMRDRGLVVVGWVLGVGLVPAAVAAGIAGSLFGAAVLGSLAVWLLAMRFYDIPRVELYPDRLVIRSFATTTVPYNEIVGVRVDSRWWAGRSALFLERGFDHVTPIPAGAGLGPPRWHLELRDELNRRTPHDLM